MANKCSNECPAAKEVADCAVRKVFAILGVDIDSPKEVEAFRENLRFGAMLRRAADRGVVTMVTVLATLMVSSVGTLLWYGFASKFLGGPK